MNNSSNSSKSWFCRGACLKYCINDSMASTSTYIWNCLHLFMFGRPLFQIHLNMNMHRRHDWYDAIQHYDWYTDWYVYMCVWYSLLCYMIDDTFFCMKCTIFFFYEVCKSRCFHSCFHKTWFFNIKMVVPKILL